MHPARLAAVVAALLVAPPARSGPPQGKPKTPANAAAAGKAAAAAPPSAAGRWEGALELPGATLKIAVVLAGAGASAWTGTFDVPQQGIHGMALAEIEVSGDDVSVALTGVPGDARWKGKLTDGGKKLVGEFSQGGMTFPLALARVPDAAETASTTLAALPDLVRKALADWKVPGAAVAVVKGDAVVLAEGYGLRDAKKRLPVTADTLFAIGSCTKAFTATLLAMLVEDGKLDWDEPVTTFLPRFHLKDAVASDHATPRDLLTHRIGLPRHDLLWYGGGLTRAQMFERLQYLEPSADFRARFQYNNLMYMSAGVLAAAAGGASWEELVRRRIFRPLAMSGAVTSIAEMKKARDFALPYADVDKVVQEVPFRIVDAVGPAGSIDASARDMARWVMLHLGGGQVAGTRLLAAASVAELHKPQMVAPSIGLSPEDAEVALPNYGLGWMVGTYRGHRAVTHGGAIDGFVADVLLLPDDGVGIVVLANLGGTPVPNIVAYAAADRVLGLPPIDWSARWLGRREMARAASKKAKERGEADRQTGTHPSHPLADYAGSYEHPGYGTATVTLAAGGVLEASIGGIPATLEHWHYDVFRATPRDKALGEERLMLQFETGLSGDIEHLAAPLESAVGPIVFERKAPARLSEPKFLGGLVGKYALEGGGPEVTIALRGERTLTAVVPGQPVYELVPWRRTEFRLKGLPGFSMRFLVDDKGAVTGLESVQPNGVFAAKRK